MEEVEQHRSSDGEASVDTTQRLTRVLPSQGADAGVEQIPPHSAQLVQQVAAGDVVGIPEALRLQALMETRDGGEVRKVRDASLKVFRRCTVALALTERMQTERHGRLSNDRKLQHSTRLHKTSQ